MLSDMSNITFYPFPGVDGLEVHVFDVDLERQIADAVFRFPADDTVALHRHVSQTNMLILGGELIIYNDDGSVRDHRKAGNYYVGSRDDVHIEGGGPEGAVVLYSVRGHGDPNVIELLDKSGAILGALTFDDIAALKAAQSG